VTGKDIASSTKKNVTIANVMDIPLFTGLTAITLYERGSPATDGDEAGGCYVAVVADKTIGGHLSKDDVHT
jgi:hypothetical protein